MPSCRVLLHDAGMDTTSKFWGLELEGLLAPCVANLVLDTNCWTALGNGDRHDLCLNPAATRSAVDMDLVSHQDCHESLSSLLPLG